MITNYDYIHGFQNKRMLTDSSACGPMVPNVLHTEGLVVGVASFIVSASGVILKKLLFVFSTSHLMELGYCNFLRC